MSTDKTQKVISIDQFRRDKKILQDQVEFQNYLKTLKQEQLQYEADFLINEIENEGATDTALNRVALLMEELASRVNGEKMTSMINEFAGNIRSKLGVEVASPLLQ